MQKRSIVYKDTSTLIPYIGNSRTHSDDQVKQIAASIQEFGFTNPILIDENNSVIAGHGRMLAAELIGQKEVPCIVLTDLTKGQQKALVIADNQLALNADWDLDRLTLELESLAELDFDIDLLGFDDDFLENLLAPEENEGLTDDDAIPEPPDDPITVLGDIWILGDHRIMCGDSTAITDIDKLMDGQRADYCFTSPPYGQQRDYHSKIENWTELMNGVYSIMPVKDGAQILVNLGLIHSDKEWQPYWDEWIEYMRELGWLRFGLYMWDQGPGMMGDWHGRLAPSFELIFHFCKENERAKKTKVCKLAGKKTSSVGNRAQNGSMKKRSHAGKPIQQFKIGDSVIRVNRQKSLNTGHPAPFPVELCREISIPWAKRGDICYEPFCGSGTQIINCEKEGFSLYGMELAPPYVDICVKRWEEFTGQDAVHADTGITYKETCNV